MIPPAVTKSKKIKRGNPIDHEVQRSSEAWVLVAFELSPETSGVWITGLRYHANLFGTESASKMQYRLNML